MEYKFTDEGLATVRTKEFAAKFFETVQGLPAIAAVPAYMIAWVATGNDLNNPPGGPADVEPLTAFMLGHDAEVAELLQTVLNNLKSIKGVWVN